MVEICLPLVGHSDIIDRLLMVSARAKLVYQLQCGWKRPCIIYIYFLRNVAAVNLGISQVFKRISSVFVLPSSDFFFKAQGYSSAVTLPTRPANMKHETIGANGIG
jgi:hypothetical protein